MHTTNIGMQTSKNNLQAKNCNKDVY